MEQTVSMKNEELKKRRKAADMTGTELARLLGVDPSTVSRIENNRLRATPQYLERCRTVLGSDLSVASFPPKVGQLRSDRRWLRDAFPPPTTLASVPLRQAFRAACQSKVGSDLVEQLDRQRRPAAEWRALRHSPGGLNADEQMFLLHGLMRSGILHETTPEDVRLELSYVTPPRHWWLALHVGPCVFFPQLTLSLEYDGSLEFEARKIRSPRLDFLAAIPCTPPLFINIEIDGFGHSGREKNDRARAAAIRLPTLRIASERLLRPDFWESFERELRKLVKDSGKKWPVYRRKRR